MKVIFLVAFQLLLIFTILSLSQNNKLSEFENSVFGDYLTRYAEQEAEIPKNSTFENLIYRFESRTRSQSEDNNNNDGKLLKYVTSKQIDLGTLLQIIAALNNIITTIGNLLAALGNLPAILFMLLPLLLIGAIGLYFIIRDLFNAFFKKGKQKHHNKPAICSCHEHKHNNNYHGGGGWKSSNWWNHDNGEDEVDGWNEDRKDRKHLKYYHSLNRRQDVEAAWNNYNSMLTRSPTYANYVGNAGNGNYAILVQDHPKFIPW